jgi:hypothetical protein
MKRSYFTLFILAVWVCYIFGTGVALDKVFCFKPDGRVDIEYLNDNFHCECELGRTNPCSGDSLSDGYRISHQHCLDVPIKDFWLIRKNIILDSQDLNQQRNFFNNQFTEAVYLNTLDCYDFSPKILIHTAVSKRLSCLCRLIC